MSTLKSGEKMSIEEFIVYTTQKLEYINGELVELSLLRAELEMVKIRLAIIETQTANLIWWFKVMVIAVVGSLITQVGNTIWNYKSRRNVNNTLEKS